MKDSVKNEPAAARWKRLQRRYGKAIETVLEMNIYDFVWNFSHFHYTMFPRWLLEGSSMPSRWSLDASEIATQKAVKMVEAGIVLRRPCATLSSSFSPCSWPPRPPPPPPPSPLVHDHPDCRRDSARSNFHSRFPRLAIKAVLSGSLGSK